MIQSLLRLSDHIVDAKAEFFEEFFRRGRSSVVLQRNLASIRCGVFVPWHRQTSFDGDACRNFAWQYRFPVSLILLLKPFQTRSRYHSRWGSFGFQALCCSYCQVHLGAGRNQDQFWRGGGFHQDISALGDALCGFFGGAVQYWNILSG